MVHTTTTTLHLHYDLEKPGYQGDILIEKLMFKNIVYFVAKFFFRL